jgi:aerobic-type carbon monoxide dehydrogenase small subunit (CoxS/CutS family)
MSKPLHVMIKVNDSTVELDVPLTETLLTSLRDRLQLTGAKRGCNQGICGACTVMLDGVAVRACLSLTANCEGQSVLTIEGLSEGETMHPLQTAFVEHGAVQCGFCIPGQIMTAAALLKRDPDPSPETIRTALKDTLCRCAGYPTIERAVQAAARSLRTGEPVAGPTATASSKPLWRPALRPCW